MNPKGLAVLAGVLFGAGLVLSDMINPARVLAFLDVAGAFDPSLAYVMAAALLPSFLAYRLRARLSAPLVAARFSLPTRQDLDAPLVIGALAFGIGWGLVGFCPGPAVAALTTPSPQSLGFLAAMLVGMLVHRLSPFGRG